MYLSGSQSSVRLAGSFRKLQSSSVAQQTDERPAGLRGSIQSGREYQGNRYAIEGAARGCISSGGAPIRLEVHIHRLLQSWLLGQGRLGRSDLPSGGVLPGLRLVARPE